VYRLRGGRRIKWVKGMHGLRELGGIDCRKLYVQEITKEDRKQKRNGIIIWTLRRRK
jgi:hypothetical protein